jgi:hypothetical protein
VRTPRRPVLIVLATRLFAGVGAVAGSILGNAAGRAGLFVGAVVGGILMTTGAVLLAGQRGWLPAPSRLGALVGGLLGFVIAAPIAVANLHTPVTPVLVTSLAGIGALLGVLARDRISAR